MTPGDARVWEDLRQALWPEDEGIHAGEIADFFRGVLTPPMVVWIAEDAGGGAVGLVELSARTDVPGLPATRTGYIEGLYLRPEARGGSAVREVLRAVRRWARAQGCEALATDRAERVIVDRRFGAKGDGGAAVVARRLDC